MSLLANHGIIGGRGEVNLIQTFFDDNGLVGSTNHVVSFDDVPEEGDNLYVWIYFAATSATVTLPTDFVERETVGGGGSNTPLFRAYHKVAGASESNSYNFITSVSIVCRVMAVSVRGANESSPILGDAANTSAATNVTSLASNNFICQAGGIVFIGYAFLSVKTGQTNGYTDLIGDGTSGVVMKKYTSNVSLESTTFSFPSSRARTISVEFVP